MNAHKLAILREWWGSIPDPDRPIAVPTYDLIGGWRARRQVLKFLREERKLARIEFGIALEMRRGREWWIRYIEGPAERELLDTLHLSVRQRQGETDAEYRTRLKKIEDALRVRLGEFLVDARAEDP